MDNEKEVIERHVDLCRTKNGNVYRVKVGLFSNVYTLIGNTKYTLAEFNNNKHKG